MNHLSFSDIIYDPILPPPIIVLIGVVLLFFTIRVYLRVGKVISPWRNFGLLLFRLAGIALVLVLLLQPSRQELLRPPSRERVTLLGIDTSASMKQRDVEAGTRLDASKNLLLESGLVSNQGIPENPHLRLFEFDADARPVAKSILDQTAQGRTTRFDQSVRTMLNSVSGSESANALILLTDGHDFELANPAKTGAAARARQTPIYAVAIGKQGHVRDVSTRITSFQPYCYVKQRARINASLRLIGCEFDDLSVQLLRDGKLVQTKRVNADEFQELPVEFEVTEPQIGQYEYEIRVQPLESEVDSANNSAITYLNVIDQQVRVLMLEGDPYWDTSFLQRSLMRNDKFDVDSLVYYGKDHLRAIRKTPRPGELKVPETAEQFSAYDVIVLGRSVDQLLTAPQITLLDRFVKERGGTVIFSRGRAFEPSTSVDLQPVIWGETSRDRVRLEAAAEGRGLSAFRALSDGGKGMDELPDLLDARKAGETKPLTATLALAANREDNSISPAIVHRRYGSGQVVSLGVEGLWRWSLNSKAEGINTPFDRFWDQMILWLLAARDFIPTKQFSFRPNSANITLGEKVYFRLTMRQPDPKVKSVPLTLFFGDNETGRANLTPPSVGATGRLMAEFLPEKVGRYRAVAKFPDGTSQESRFIVFSENLEETEVATDVVGLRRLCESSGGRLIEPAELPRLFKELNSEKTDDAPRTKLLPIWNTPWVFYLAGVLFGGDWFLRRRWGLS